MKIPHKNNRVAFLGVAFFAFALSLLPACGGGTSSTPSVTKPGPCDTELTEGKAFLMQGNYFSAQDRYYQCLENYPESVTKYSIAVGQQQQMTARYGFVLAQTLYTMVQVSTSIESLVSSAGGLLQGTGLNITQQTTSPSINAIVNDVVYGIIQKQADYLRPYLKELLDNSPVEPVFQIDDLNTTAIESIPIYLGKNNEVLWLSFTGHLDRREIQLIDSFLAVTQGLSETLLTINFDIDLNAVVNAAVQLVAGIIAGTPIQISENLFLGAPTADSGLVIVPMISSLAAFTLNSSPSFMTLNYSSLLPLGGGPPLLLDAAGKIGEGCGGFLSAFEWIRGQAADDKNPFTFVTKDGKENFRFTYLDPTGAQKVVDITTRPEFFSAIQNIQNSVAGTSASAGTNPRVSWGGDLSWLISYGAAILLQTGGVNALMDITVAKISPSLSSQLKGFTQSLPLSPDLINGVLLSAVPDAIQLDLGYFFHNPKDRYLRDVLPYWTNSPSDPGNGYLILEYECPIPTVYNDANTYPLGATAYTCPAGTITDAGHFTGLDINQKPAEIASLPVAAGGIPPDEILASLPYIAWQDPTFNHLLYVNLTNVGCATCSPTFAEPGLWDFNYFTIKLIGSLLSLVQSLLGSGLT